MIAQQSAKALCAYAYASAGVENLRQISLCRRMHSGGKRHAPRRQPPLFTRGQRSGCLRRSGALLSQRRQNGSFPDNATLVPPPAYRVIDAPVPALEEAQINRAYDKHPFVPDDRVKREERCREILSIQAAGLAKRLSHTGMQKLVLGISGGLDSTLALLVSVRTMDIFIGVMVVLFVVVVVMGMLNK